MNQRERILAISVGALVAALVLWYGTSWLLARFDEKDRRIESLVKDVQKKKKDVAESQAAARRLADYEQRSLPRDPDLAASLYQQWLIRVMEQAQFTDVDVSVGRTVQARNTYNRLTFTVGALGDLGQLVDFLHRFQEMDWLHRIELMNVTPLNDSKKLQLSFTITALAVNSAPKSEQLAPRTSEKWKATSLADYRDPILNRNVFGAPNNEPKLDLPSRSTAYLGRTFELSAKATDPDPLDRVTYLLTTNTDPPAKIDAQSGKLTWTPKSKGDFSFEIVARDDGLPSKSKSKILQVTVTDPPKPPPPEPKRLAFDHAKYTILTAVISVTNGQEEPGSGQSEIWFHVRPSNEIRKLQVGDKFDIGSVKGEVSEIGVDDAILMVAGKLHRIVKGDSLFDAVADSD